MIRSTWPGARALFTRYGCALLLAGAILAPAPAQAEVRIGDREITVRGDGASATIEREPFRIAFGDGAGRTVLAQVENSGAGPRVEPATPDPEPNGGDAQPDGALYSPLTFTVGSDRLEQFQAGTWVGNLLSATRSGVTYAAQNVIAAVPEGDGVRLTLSTNDPTGRTLAATVLPQPGAIRVSVRAVPEAGVAVTADSFASGPDEAFRGFGGRHNALDQRGGRLESFLNQSNVSPGTLEPAVAAAPSTGGDRYMYPNGPTGAYFVQSSFVSSRPYGFLALRDELTRWRMALDRPDAWQVAASAPALDYLVAVGEAPRAIETLTAVTGRQRVPPAWALQPQIDRLVRFPAQPAAEYRGEVLRDLADIERYDMPVGAYRIEAWEFFPRDELRDVIARFHRRGIRVLLYFRAFVGQDEIGTDTPARYDEAVANGYVATRADGSPYTFTSNFYAPGAVIDFTDPAAVRWWRERITEALALGADGFMQDFGEQVLTDMHFDDGSTGATMHNRLPVLFHRATREAIDAYAKSHPGRGDVYFFTRSGYSGTPGSVAYESATWPGDETTDFSRSSGLASQAPDMLNRGIAGAVGFGSDIGGYFDFAHEPTTKELFLRWAAWSALTPIFRLHGSVGAGTHMPWTYDAETVAIYRRLSRLHQAAAPLILRLWREAARNGAPIARPLWLAFPDDPRAGREEQSWMLGPDVLVAPVVEQGATGREVYFPAGCWSSPETGEHHSGPGSARVAAAPGALPYYFRCGTRPFEPPPSPSVAGRCRISRGFRSATVRPRGRGAAIRFRRRAARPVTVDILRASTGRRATRLHRVRRFPGRSRGFRWNGSGGRRPGIYVVRLRMRGFADVRHFVLQRRGGRLASRAPYRRRPSCGVLRRLALSGPAFGGRTGRPLRVRLQISRRARVRVALLRGGRRVRTLTNRARPSGPMHLKLRAARLPRGTYRVQVTVGRRQARVTARRL